MKYYPSNRVKVNQRTSGGEFTLQGKPYKGSYYETFEGNYYTGKDPIQGPSEKLTKITTSLPGLVDGEAMSKNAIAPVITGDIVTYQASNPAAAQAGRSTTTVPGNIPTFQLPQPYFPQPTADDYARKSFMRYFAKRRNQKGYVIEVNKATHDSLKNTDSVYDYVTYEAISTLWQLVGPLYDEYTPKRYKLAGIVDTNKRLIEAKESSFPGLVAFIGGDYAKFAKPTK